LTVSWAMIPLEQPGLTAKRIVRSNQALMDLLRAGFTAQYWSWNTTVALLFSAEDPSFGGRTIGRQHRFFLASL
jgi:hypothetical protein